MIEGRPDFNDWVNGGNTTTLPAQPRPPVDLPIGLAGGGTPYANKALASECAELSPMGPDTGRNHQLNESAFNMKGLIDAGQISEDEVVDALVTAARQCGLDESEIMPTIRSGFRGSATKVGARVVPDRPDAAGDTTFVAGSTQNVGHEGTKHVPAGEDVDQLAETLSHFTDGATFILDIPDTVPAVWGDGNEVLWMEGESLMIAGPMGLGKTTLGGQLMRAQLGIGDPTVLDLPVTPAPGRILYLAMDRPAQARRAMARQFGGDNRRVLAERLVVWQGPPPADIAKYPGMLLWLAEQAEADVVYLDSVKDAAIGLSEDEVGAGYNRARQQLLASGRQLCELHHTTKRGANGGPPKDVADIYGSTWITNGTGSIVLLTGQPGDPIVGLHHARQPMEEVGPYKLLHDQATGAMSIMHETNLTELARHAGPDGLTARAAAVAVTGDEDAKPTDAQVEKARRKLDALSKQGLLRRVEGDKSKQRPTVWFIHEGTSFAA